MSADPLWMLERVRIATTDAEIESCFACIQELRPHLEAESFCGRIRSLQESGYRLAYITELGEVVAVAGYRLMDNLFLGPSLYVDDLVTTAKARSRGHGAILIRWLKELALDNGCGTLHLDSGVQRDRAHRFYFDNGFHISSFHFSQSLLD